MKRLWPLARRYWFDAALLAGLGVALAEVTVRQGEKDGPGGPLWFDILGVVAIMVPLFARRRFPFAAPAAVGLAFAVGSFGDGSLVHLLLPVLAGFPAVFLIAMVREPSRAAAGLALTVGLVMVVGHNDPRGSVGNSIFVSVVLAIVWTIAFGVGRTYVAADAAKERAERAEREREVRAEAAVAEERARIARELHDVVGHSVSVMTVQASAVRRLLKPEQEREREALLVVERTGREALAEMRRMMGVLRRPEEAPALAPQPSLEHVEKLVEQAREAGLPVELRVEGDAVELPAGVDLTAYRLVQEGLTNALKHAHARRAEVLVRYGDGQIEVAVSDDGRGLGTGDGGGHGLVGMRERVSVYGGAGGGAPARGRLPAARQAPGGARVSLGVLIVDDQALVRAGFRMILEAEEDIEVVGEAADGRQAVAEARRLKPDVILMDVRMPEVDGIEATRVLLDADATSTKVVMLTTFDMDEYVYDALRAGASGFLLKDVPPEQLVAGIRSVASGDALLAPSVTRRVIEEFVRRPPASVRTLPPQVDELTARELEVLKLIARGLSNAEIAKELYVSETTVKSPASASRSSPPPRTPTARRSCSRPSSSRTGSSRRRMSIRSRASASPSPRERSA